MFFGLTISFGIGVLFGAAVYSAGYKSGYTVGSQVGSDIFNCIMKMLGNDEEDDCSGN